MVPMKHACTVTAISMPQLSKLCTKGIIPSQKLQGQRRLVDLTALTNYLVRAIEEPE